jgi:hypothetical protein
MHTFRKQLFCPGRFCSPLSTLVMCSECYAGRCCCQQQKPKNTAQVSNNMDPKLGPSQRVDSVWCFGLGASQCAFNEVLANSPHLNTVAGGFVFVIKLIIPANECLSRPTSQARCTLSLLTPSFCFLFSHREAHKTLGRVHTQSQVHRRFSSVLPDIRAYAYSHDVHTIRRSLCTCVTSPLHPTYIHTYTDTHADTHTDTHADTHTYTHIYTHTHKDTHTHTDTAQSPRDTSFLRN